MLKIEQLIGRMNLRRDFLNIERDFEFRISGFRLFLSLTQYGKKRITKVIRPASKASKQFFPNNIIRALHFREIVL